jgi:hypothetical protein
VRCSDPGALVQPQWRRTETVPHLRRHKAPPPRRGSNQSFDTLQANRPLLDVIEQSVKQLKKQSRRKPLTHSRRPQNRVGTSLMFRRRLRRREARRVLATVAARTRYPNAPLPTVQALALPAAGLAGTQTERTIVPATSPDGQFPRRPAGCLLEAGGRGILGPQGVIRGRPRWGDQDT